MQMCKLDSEEIRNSFETCTSINVIILLLLFREG